MNQRLAAFDFITECIGIRDTTDINEILHSTVISGHLDWPTILAITNAKKIASTLWVALRKRKLVEYLPNEVRQHLFKIYLLNSLKNMDFMEQTTEVVRLLNSIGIEPILLKGSVSLFVKTFDDPGSRMMVDLDILVPKKSAEKCWNALGVLGYLPIENRPNLCIDYQGNHHHLRPLYRPGKCGTIELHKDALPTSAAQVLPTRLIWEQAEAIINQSGIAMSVPSPTHRVLHNLLHSDLINQTYVRGQISLRSLHELAMMQNLYQERIDWETIWQLMDKGSQARILRSSIYLTNRLFGSPIPDQIDPTLSSAIHCARTRLQVRWNWLDQFVEQVFWFTTKNICERYHCEDRFWPVAKGRVRLAVHLSCKYTSRAFNWIKWHLYSLYSSSIIIAVNLTQGLEWHSIIKISS